MAIVAQDRHFSQMGVCLDRIYSSWLSQAHRLRSLGHTRYPSTRQDLLSAARPVQSSLKNHSAAPLAGAVSGKHCRRANHASQAHCGVQSILAWWSNLDDEVYIPLENLRASAATVPLSSLKILPESLSRYISGPTAIFARHVASPNYEMLWFIRLARRHGFNPLVIEHASDRFTRHNPAKRALVSIPIVTGRSRNGQPILRRQSILDPAAAEGQRLDEIITQTGEPLLGYHHRKLAKLLGTDTPNVTDLREVISPSTIDPASYYQEFFAMLSGHLVLLEDFVADDQTAKFFQNIIEPAWRSAISRTGRRPQIARLTPGRRAASALWVAYPAAMADSPSWVHRSQGRMSDR